MAEEKQRIKKPVEAKTGLNYDDSLSSRIEQMVNNELLSDVTFLVGPEKQRIFAHKLHLVTASEYFYSLFYGNFVEAELDEIEMLEEDPEIFLSILRIIYGAEVEITYENIRDIYNRMKMYLLPIEYYKPMINFLGNQIVDKDTAMKIFRENHYYNFEFVDALCIPYIQNNPLYYFRKDDFSKIEEEIMYKIVGFKQINCTDEQLLFAIQKCESTNAKFDLKTLEKLVSTTARKYFAHKLPFLGYTLRSANVPGNNIFSLNVTSKCKVSLYGIGVYIIPTTGVVSAKLYLCGTNRDFKEICFLNFGKRSNPRLEIVDLMFEEIVMTPNSKYEFQLILSNSDGYVVFRLDVNPTLIHNNDSIAYSFNRSDPYGLGDAHALAHLWVK